MKKFEIIITGKYFDEKLNETTNQRFHRYAIAENGIDAMGIAVSKFIPEILCGFYKGTRPLFPLEIGSVKCVG